ncbi:MAG TPA: ABC transporter permease [Flavipsychrobacter sp.]|nr:ABC transporter permease [Flavipsychrobacter sp.]
MRKIAATITKEWILLKRDLGGIALLFLMPVMMIVVMALIQDAPFKDYQALKFDLLLVNNDKGKLADEIIEGFNKSKNFNVIQQIDGHTLNDASLKQHLKNGKYNVGIIIPEGATAEVVNAANLIANELSEKLGMGGTLPAREARGTAYVRVLFDPVAKPTFRSSISFAIDKYVTYSCSNLLVQRLSKMAATEESTASESAQTFAQVFQGIGVKEEMLEKERDRKLINSTQHNVPSWAIFGMFFIVIPIAGHMIREREDGSATRIALIPYTWTMVSLGQILFYTLICAVQFWCMIAIGIWFLPLLGLSKLYLGLNALHLVPVSLAIAFSATAYGYFIGSIFKTINQALPLGAVSVVILSALGGLWVPIELLPEVMKKVAKFSPLNWGLDAVNAVTLRNGTLLDILPHLMVLLLFGVLLWAISILYSRSRKMSIQ